MPARTPKPAKTTAAKTASGTRAKSQAKTPRKTTKKAAGTPQTPAKRRARRNPPPTHRRGRPSSLTPQVKGKIVEAVRAGNYIETAVLAAGIDRTTYFLWMRRGRTLRADMLEAEEEGHALELGPEDVEYLDFLYSVEKAEAEAEMESLNIVRRSKEWQAHMTYLERKYPKRFGRQDRTEIVHEGGSRPVRVELSHEEQRQKTVKVLEELRTLGVFEIAAKQLKATSEIVIGEEAAS